jgi:protein required for attachment to host cells
VAKKIREWFVIADGARAKIWRREGAAGPLEPVMARERPEARARTRELGADRPGRSFESATTAAGMRHGMEPPTDWQRFEKQKFARELAEILNEAGVRDDYDRLVLVAPAPALGELRKALGAHATDRLAAEIAKDLTNLPEHELPKRLEGYL